MKEINAMTRAVLTRMKVVYFILIEIIINMSTTDVNIRRIALINE